jgi:glutamate-ammonia-ligase adenylyltransferase
MFSSFYNYTLTNRNKMQISVAEKALSAVKSYNSSSETSIDSALFQFISKALTISPFVADVINAQCQQSLIQVDWHARHSASEFDEYLALQTGSLLFKQPFELQLGQIPDLTEYAADFQSENSIMALLRKIRRTHSAAIAILELNNALTIEESMLRMSILAEQLTCAAYLWSYATQQQVFGTPQANAEHIFKPVDKNLQQNLLILAMGKFGGYELNFSSDIDLIFFYPSEGETSGGRRTTPNSRFFQKVGVLLIKLLNELTEDSFVFRVDMRLRPYGDSGNLVMSVDQAEDYYHEQGRGWERFAMVRARIITGRLDEQRQLEEIITPFAFRRYIDYGVIDSLRNMKEMIQREVRRRGLKGNIKLGAGGIREIEFMVQSLQLIQGGRDSRLQEKSILQVLPLLAEVKLLPRETSNKLAENYRFLRRVEHCIQELDEKQTQQLPKEPHTQQIIARLMSFANWADFNQALEKIQRDTNNNFNSLFGEERTQSEQRDDFYLSLWEGHINDQQLLDKLPDIDKNDTGQLIEMLNKFSHSNLVTNLSARGAKRLKLFFPALLAIGLAVDNPVKTLNSLLIILKAILKRTAYLELLSENLPILQHLVDLVSRSDWIVQRLSDCPILFDELLYPNSLYEPLQTSDLKSELQQSLLRIDESDEEQILDAIRRFKQINELRVAAALLSERLSISQVNRYLTQLAQVIIQAAINQCWRVLTLQYGEPEALATANQGRDDSLPSVAIGFTVVAYGKLGGLELGFNSDLDLVFLFDQLLDSQTNGKKPISMSRFYTRLAQKIIHFLSTRTSLGVLYEVDMRLRPSGNSGMLVSHIDAFKDYQNESAWTWEHQALIRARAIAGDVQLSQKFEQVRSSILNAKREPKKLKTDVLDMRNKMRQELDKSTLAQIDLKQCVGGLVDIEFLSQYLILNCPYEIKGQNGSVGQNSPPSNTAEALKYVQANQQINQKDASRLIKTYRSYRNCLNEMAIASGEKLVDGKLFVDERANVKKIWNSLFSD